MIISLSSQVYNVGWYIINIFSPFYLDDIQYQEVIGKVNQDLSVYIII